LTEAVSDSGHRRSQPCMHELGRSTDDRPGERRSVSSSGDADSTGATAGDRYLVRGEQGSRRSPSRPSPTNSHSQGTPPRASSAPLLAQRRERRLKEDDGVRFRPNATSPPPSQPLRARPARGLKPCPSMETGGGPEPADTLPASTPVRLLRTSRSLDSTNGSRHLVQHSGACFCLPPGGVWWFSADNFMTPGPLTNPPPDVSSEHPQPAHGRTRDRGGKNP